jgi:hypothetical protein
LQKNAFLTTQTATDPANFSKEAAKLWLQPAVRGRPRPLSRDFEPGITPQKRLATKGRPTAC